VLSAATDAVGRGVVGALGVELGIAAVATAVTDGATTTGVGATQEVAHARSTAKTVIRVLIVLSCCQGTALQS
jgi:hypothetical protein